MAFSLSSLAHPDRRSRPSLSVPVFVWIFLWIHRCMNTCNRSRLLFLSGRPRRRPNLHILYRADCPVYCVQPTAELLHIEHKLELLHDNKSHNSIEHVRLVSLTKTSYREKQWIAQRFRNRNCKFHFETYFNWLVCFLQPNHVSRSYLIINISSIEHVRLVSPTKIHIERKRGENSERFRRRNWRFHFENIF